MPHITDSERELVIQTASAIVRWDRLYGLVDNHVYASPVEPSAVERLHALLSFQADCAATDEARARYAVDELRREDALSMRSIADALLSIRVDSEEAALFQVREVWDDGKMHCVAFLDNKDDAFVGVVFNRDWLLGEEVEYVVRVTSRGVHTWFPALRALADLAPVVEHVANELREVMAVADSGSLLHLCEDEYPMLCDESVMPMMRLLDYGDGFLEW